MIFSTKKIDSFFHLLCLKKKEWFSLLFAILSLTTALDAKISITPGKVFYPDSQFIDPGCGLVFPWYTKPFLDVLKEWDMRTWDVFEYGAGSSTGWFAHHCKSVTSVDNNTDWVDGVREYAQLLGLSNIVLKLRSCEHNGMDVESTPYVQALNENDMKYDCIIIDGVVRTRDACAVVALRHIKIGGIIIVDNVNQETVYDATKTVALLNKFEHHSFLQLGWPTHWRTDYWVIR